MIKNNYKKSKIEALNKEPIYKIESIKSVYFINNKYISLNGKEYPACIEFYKEITREIGLNFSIFQQINKHLSDKDTFAILNKLFANYFRQHKPIDCNIIANKNKKELFRLSKADIIPYEIIFEAIDKIKDKFNSIYLDVHDTQIKILLNEDEEVKINGFSKENFSPNIGIAYLYGRSFNIIKVIERITCTNQISTSLASQGEKQMSGINTTHKIIHALIDLQNNKINDKYIKNVQRVANIQASLKEYETTFKLLTKFIDKKNDFLLNKLIRKDEVDMYIKHEHIFKKGDIEIPKEKQILPIHYWDLINAITDFASHDYLPLNEQERYNLKTKAFNMLYYQEPDIMKYNLN